LNISTAGSQPSFEYRPLGVTQTPGTKPPA